MSFGSITENLAGWEPPHLPAIIENTGRWNVTKTPNDYTICDKTSPSVETMQFTNSDKFRLESAFALAWRKHPSSSLDQIIEIVWKRFYARAVKAGRLMR
jgi:hypothetical protein